MKESTKEKIKIYIVAIAIPLAVGILSMLLTNDNMSLYEDIVMPPLSPPAPLFGIVWGILYVLMGVSSAMVFIDRKVNASAASKGLSAYCISLFFNLLWSVLFFNLRAFFFSFIWLAALFCLIVRTVIEYKKINRWAAYLQIPYLLWVAFAGYLNIAIAFLNM